MEDVLAFGSRDYFIFLGVLLFARGMDFLSTWTATPNLALEANPIAKKLGWRWGMIANFGLCGVVGMFPLPAVIISTTSVLVAAHNFQHAALMRSMGETSYQMWMRARLEQIPIGLYLGCLLGQTLLTAAVGGALVWASGGWPLVLGIGLGILGYAAAVLIFTLISVWRSRRAAR